MRLSSLLFAVTSAAVQAAAARKVSRAEQGPVANSILVTNSYIVELEPTVAQASGALQRTHGVDVVKHFASNVFNGASVLTNTHNADSLLKIPGVARVWVNRQIKLVQLNAHDAADSAASAKYTTHNVTGVTKLHNLGYYGKGVKIGIVDTGTYYPHPALGGCFGPGCRIAGGHDFVGDGQWPAEAKQPDADPIDHLGHGTHVAGIIAGNDKYFQGVAPQADIYSYKVFSAADSTDTETLIDAFLTAYNDGCDIITASVGDDAGWASEPWAVVASRLVDKGVIVTISAGNHGTYGPFYGSSGSSGNNVIAVASVETEMLPATPFRVTFQDGATNQTALIGYLPYGGYFPSDIADWPVVPMGLVDGSVDACSEYPDGTPSLQRRIPLLRQGGCNDTVKQVNLEALGAGYILVYDDDEPLQAPATAGWTSSVAAIEGKSGQAIIDAVRAGQIVTADFSSNPEEVVSLPYPAGGLPNDFSSWGGTYDLGIKPEIAAPGGDIFSTWVADGWRIMSGTSMACPYVAGVAALYVQAHGGRGVHGEDFAKMFRWRVVTSGRALPWAEGDAANYNFTASVAQMGTGLIDAYKVVQYDTQLVYDDFALNDTDHFAASHRINLTNTGKSEVLYSFDVQPAAGVYTLGEHPDGRRLNSLSELVPRDMLPGIHLPQNVTLLPGESKVVSVMFDPVGQQGWDAASMPLYSGKILVSGDNGELLSVPYMGVGASLQHDVPTVFQNGSVSCYSLTNKTDVAEKNWFTMNLDSTVQDFPQIAVQNIWGTEEVRWDIYKSNWSETQWEYPPVPGQNGYVGTVATWYDAGKVDTFYPDYYDANDTINYPLSNMERVAPPGTTATGTETTHLFWWFGKLGNGSQIELGSYTMRFAMLKPFGDRTKATGWDVFQPRPIEIRGKY